MRHWLLVLVCSLVLGCASEERVLVPGIEHSPVQANKQTVRETPRLENTKLYEVYPITLNLPKSKGYKPFSDYLEPLLENLSEQSIYQLKNSHQLQRQYRFIKQVSSSDARKTVFSLKQPATAHWGYVTTSIGSKGIANAFLIESAKNGRQYALVIKHMKICLVSRAGAAPSWRSGRWSFSKRPGDFECTGSSRYSVFRPESGFPGLLGAYYSDQDTVLVFKQPGELKRLVRALKRQFPQLKIPVIPSGSTT